MRRQANNVMATSAIRGTVLGVVLVTLLYFGCDDPVEAPVPCPAIVLPAIEVKAIDAVTLEIISGAAHGLVTNGEHADSLRVCSFDDEGRVFTRCGAAGFSGTFYVMVSAVGYQPWDSTGVVVHRGQCGNLTTNLEIALTPLAINQRASLESGRIGLSSAVLQPTALRGVHE